METTADGEERTPAMEAGPATGRVPTQLVNMGWIKAVPDSPVATATAAPSSASAERIGNRPRGARALVEGFQRHRPAARPVTTTTSSSTASTATKSTAAAISATAAISTATATSSTLGSTTLETLEPPSKVGNATGGTVPVAIARGGAPSTTTISTTTVSTTTTTTTTAGIMGKLAHGSEASAIQKVVADIPST
eukprot:1178051-Prorocentrum_minimum.AAC.13